MQPQSSLEKKTLYVVVITAITMVVEIIFGLTTHSMALLADGIHMGSHVFAIGLSWMAYVIVRRLSNSKRYSANNTKILSLSGYTSGLMLVIFAVFILVEAITRLVNPIPIMFNEAIVVAIIGLIINLVSAAILHHEHDHDPEHEDHNIKAAYLHVIADALTSIAAIAGLFAAKYFGWLFVDALAAIISSMVIIKWSLGLLFESGFTLTDLKKHQ